MNFGVSRSLLLVLSSASSVRLDCIDYSQIEYLGSPQASPLLAIKVRRPARHVQCWSGRAPPVVLPLPSLILGFPIGIEAIKSLLEHQRWRVLHQEERLQIDNVNR